MKKINEVFLPELLKQLVGVYIFENGCIYPMLTESEVELTRQNCRVILVNEYAEVVVYTFDDFYINKNHDYISADNEVCLLYNDTPPEFDELFEEER